MLSICFFFIIESNGRLWHTVVSAQKAQLMWLKCLPTHVYLEDGFSETLAIEKKPSVLCDSEIVWTKKNKCHQLGFCANTSQQRTSEFFEILYSWWIVNFLKGPPVKGSWVSVFLSAETMSVGIRALIKPEPAFIRLLRTSDLESICTSLSVMIWYLAWYSV